MIVLFGLTIETRELLLFYFTLYFMRLLLAVVNEYIKRLKNNFSFTERIACHNDLLTKTVQSSQMKMALVENIPPSNADSEMEEGEIVDDLSDISSEEEFLLRQRLQVLENYNNVLERKKAKSSSGPGTKHTTEDTLLYELSEISATELDDYYSHAPHRSKVQKRQKTHHRQKRKKLEPSDYLLKTKNLPQTRDYKKKTSYTKKKLAVKVVSESSEESEDEYRNRRRKLADAVVLNKNTYKNDKTSLSERLQKMLCGVAPEPTKVFLNENKITDNDIDNLLEESRLSLLSSLNVDNHNIFNAETKVSIPKKAQSCELIDLCTDEDSKNVPMELQQDTVDSVSKDIIKKDADSKKDSGKESISDKDSDEDLELLRQHALKTKTIKANSVPNDVQTENKVVSDDEDSDTAELRLICLKSALLKKAIERKQKQKLKKRLSQSSNFPDDLLNSENNTDIESVDMDIGSDAEEKTKENLDGSAKTDTGNEQNIPELTNSSEKHNSPTNVPVVDELEEDEDLLRAKLLTSLSKNLPNLVNPKVVDSMESMKEMRPISPKPPPVPARPVPTVVPEGKTLIIALGESDSEGEHEATMNLTKMHLKLSEQIDFQQKLDTFLKSTRMEVEKSTLPDVVQQPAQPKKNEKFVAKAVNHLPKSEQIEYKNLVKRMAELEKIKQARQTIFTLSNKVSAPVKDTLKPRNITVDASKLSAINNLEEKIKISRKNIAEESAKMLKLKEEGLKLSQKYKIVATELRNIKTAIALNKKQTRSVQTCLTKIRLHHQMLLKSSMTSAHSNINGTLPLNKIIPRLQKENNPATEDHIIPPVQNKTVKVGIKENNMAKDEHKSLIGHRLVRENNLSTEDTKNPVHKPVKELNMASERKIPLAENDASIDSQEPVVKPLKRLSISIDVTSNKKVVKMTNNKSKLNIERQNMNEDTIEKNIRLSSHPIVENGGGKEEATLDRRRLENDDYRSPLDAIGISTWEGDPNAILCPFEVGGDCKDADCIYLHTQSRST